MENLWKIYGSGPVETISQPQVSKMPPEVRLEVWNSSKACYPFVRMPNLLPESNRQCDVNHNDLFCPFLVWRSFPESITSSFQFLLLFPDLENRSICDFF